MQRIWNTSVYQATDQDGMNLGGCSEHTGLSSCSELKWFNLLKHKRQTASVTLCPSSLFKNECPRGVIWSKWLVWSRAAARSRTCLCTAAHSRTTALPPRLWNQDPLPFLHGCAFNRTKELNLQCSAVLVLQSRINSGISLSGLSDAILPLPCSSVEICVCLRK